MTVVSKHDVDVEHSSSFYLVMPTVWGSNTAVGKTLVSAGLVVAARRAARLPMLYLKPVQTGFPADSDGAVVARVAGGTHRLGAHAAAAAGSSAEAGARKWSPNAPAFDAGSSIECCTLFAWQQAVSPHLAVEREGRAASDEAVLRAAQAELDAASAAACEFVLVETAGGVASPAPSGALQCDLLAPLKLPALLVGDGGLGGISATLCAYEALDRRGMSVSAVALLEGDLENHVALRKHLDVPVLTLPPITSEHTVEEWLDEAATPLDELLRMVSP